MFGSNAKDAAFFDAFTAHANKSVEAAQLLATMLRSMQKTAGPGAAPVIYQTAPADASPAGAEELQRLAGKIKEIENAGDTITHQTVKRLRENWITPLDRNDIHALISRLDDVLDMIEAASERIILFRVGTAAPEASELAELIVRSCENLGRATTLLRTMKRAPEILELCVEVNRLENAADGVYRRALAELFRPGNDPLTVMKWRDIFDSMESAADRCEDVANVLEGVVLEYA